MRLRAADASSFDVTVMFGLLGIVSDLHHHFDQLLKVRDTVDRVEQGNAFGKPSAAEVPAAHGRFHIHIKSRARVIQSMQTDGLELAHVLAGL